jgi:hypothetical protein
MALFGLGAFGKGVATGLFTSLDKAAQGGFERIRDNIDEFSKATIKREQKAIEKTEAEANEVMEALRSAQSVLGGTNDPASAARAGALLEDIGDLDDFKAVVSNLKEYKLNNTETYDFTKYFDTQVETGAVNLSDVATNYVLGRQQPMREVAMPEMKGGGFGRLFGVDVGERARTKADAQLAALGLVKPQEKDIALPSITFKSEAFKLDRMNPEQEREYLKNKMLDPDTSKEKMDFYRTRYTDLSDRMGLDAQIESVTFQLNMEQDPNKKKDFLLDLQKLNRQQNEFNILATGDKVKIKEFELSEALASGDREGAMAIRKQLQEMGALSLSDVIAARTENLYADLAAGEDVQAEIDELANLSKLVKDTKQAIEGMPDPTSTGTRAAYQNVDSIVNIDIASNPEFAKAGITMSRSGALIIPDVIDENLKMKLSKYRTEKMREVATSLANAMPNDPDIQLVVNMLGQGYTADDIEALGNAEPPIDDMVPRTEQPVDSGISENVADRDDLTTDEEKRKASAFQKIYGEYPDTENLFNLFSDFHDKEANILSSKGMENMLMYDLEKIYGPAVAAQFSQQVKDYASQYSGFDDAALNEYPSDSLEGQIVSVIRELENTNPDFTVEAIAPIVKQKFYKGDRSVDIPGIMGTVSSLVSKHRKQRPTNLGYMTPEREKEINAIRSATGQPLVGEDEKNNNVITSPAESSSEESQVEGTPISIFNSPNSVADMHSGDRTTGLMSRPPYDARTQADIDREARISRTTEASASNNKPQPSFKGATPLQLAVEISTGDNVVAAMNELQRRMDNESISAEEMNQIGEILRRVKGQR